MHGKRLRGRVAPLLTGAVTLTFLLLAGVGMARFDRSLHERQLSAVRSAVQAAAVHCYALEGSYPPNLAYLQRNYGLVLDTEHFIYDYSVFAPNIPPEIHVFSKE